MVTLYLFCIISCLADPAAEGERVRPVNAHGAVDLLVREGGAAVLS